MQVVLLEAVLDFLGQRQDLIDAVVRVDVDDQTRLRLAAVRDEDEMDEILDALVPAFVVEEGPRR